MRYKRQECASELVSRPGIQRDRIGVQFGLAVESLMNKMG